MPPLRAGRSARPDAPHFVRRAAAVAALGLAGVAALLLLPLPPGIATQMPALAGASPLAIQAALASSPAALVIVAACIGAALAHRVGLVSLVAGTVAGRPWAGTLLRCATAGLAFGIGLAAVDTLMLPLLGEAGERLSLAGPTGATGRAVGLLYGGLAEEVMLRWGVMSLVAWSLSSLPGRPGGRAAMIVANLAAALLFGAAHLPVVAAMVEPTPPVVARTLLLNGVAGLLYGWLFWRHHLEAAMAAHAGTHLGLWAWSVAQA